MLERNIDTVRAPLIASERKPCFYISSVKQRVNSSAYSHLSDVAIVLPLDIDWEKRQRGSEQSEQQDVGADPAILMHMLHRNIDQLFSLTPSGLGNCLSVFLLFKLTAFWRSSSSNQRWKPQAEQ